MSKREQAIERNVKQAALDKKHDKKVNDTAREMTEKLKRAAVKTDQIDSELESDSAELESDQSYDEQSGSDGSEGDEYDKENESDSEESEELPPVKKKKH